MIAPTKLECLEDAFNIQFQGKTPRVIPKPDKKRFHTTVNDVAQRKQVGFGEKGAIKDAVDEFLADKGYKLELYRDDRYAYVLQR